MLEARRPVPINSNGSKERRRSLNWQVASDHELEEVGQRILSLGVSCGACRAGGFRLPLFLLLYN